VVGRAPVIRRAVRVLDERAGAAPLLRRSLRYVFPDHWSFLLGEIALYAFVVLVGTGVYLAFFFDPSSARTVYDGSYEPLRGIEMTQAYRSVVDLSFDVKAGLLIRQTHHWAANVFVAAIVLHLLRVFFTGAFRKPRELIYLVGLTMLVLALVEGFLGYSLPDDLLSGMGLAIAYSVALSIPVIGANVALLAWGAPFPGDTTFWPRMYALHILVLPVAIGLLLAVHVALIVARHHTQFRRTQLGHSRETERTIVGLPLVPGYVPRSLGLFFSVCAVLFLLGGLVQINPIWLWGPFDPAQSTNGAQPDWYLGWLIGALRLVPQFDLTIGDYTLVPNAFWGGAAFPLVVFGFLFAWPAIERRVTGDRLPHNLLDRPRDAPWRTAIGAAFVAWVGLVFLFGSADRVQVTFGLDYVAQLWAYRVLVWVLPVAVGLLVHRLCLGLQEHERLERAKHEAEREAKAAG
jgi:ubiquinol-cytochrome c reductase cytochrome b subunit